MLSKINRLNGQKNFDYVFSQGKNYQSNYLILRIAATKNKFWRLGLIISGRVDKRAVIRNRLRRRLSTIIRQQADNLRTGFDVIISVKPALVALTLKDIEKDSLSLLKKSKWLL